MSSAPRTTLNTLYKFYNYCWERNEVLQASFLSNLFLKNSLFLMFYTMLSCESLPCLVLQNRPAMCLCCTTQRCVEGNTPCLVSAELAYKEWTSWVQLLTSQSPCCQMQNSDNLVEMPPKENQRFGSRI